MKIIFLSSIGVVFSLFPLSRAYIHILCKINLAIFDVAYIFDHHRAILDISLI